MITQQLTIRPQNLEDNDRIVDYFHSADPTFLRQMGVEPSMIYPREYWHSLLHENYNKPDIDKKFYYLIWLLDDKPIGHCNINKIIPGEEAHLHLHLWDSRIRQKGLGVAFLKQSIPQFFSIYSLQTLYCEPNALNIAPNKTLARLGFKLVEQYETIPGAFHFKQPVNKWRIMKEELNRI